MECINHKCVGEFCSSDIDCPKYYTCILHKCLKEKETHSQKDNYYDLEGLLQTPKIAKLKMPIGKETLMKQLGKYHFFLQKCLHQFLSDILKKHY